jgi:hypothetical protein
MERIGINNCVLEPQKGDLWLTRAEVADRLRLPLSTLNGWASRGLGPRYAVFGRHARYRLIDVLKWEEQQFLAACPTPATKPCDQPP